MSFPKKKYATTGGHVTVENETEEKNLGAGWYDLPQPLPVLTPAQEARRVADLKKTEAAAEAKQAADLKAAADAKAVAEAKKPKQV